MNTVKSTWYGWGVLILAGGGAYYFAKRDINAGRQARFDAERAKRKRLDQMAYSRSRLAPPSPPKSTTPGRPSPNKDPAVTTATYPDDKKPPAPSLPLAKSGRGVKDKNGYMSEDHVGSPSSEASHDPAPISHVPETTEERELQKSKYEAADPWKAKKGGRFS